MKKVLQIFLISFASITGILLGIGIANTYNAGVIQRYTKQTIALPTKVLDTNNNLITTFFSVENRKLVPFNELPRILYLALITREDKTFFNHQGFSIKGTLRAAWNLLRKQYSPTGGYVSGGSTLSQQVAGVLYADRREFSIKRKLRELWWSILIEKNWSKQEILEEYLNKMYFGHGNYGVETSSQFFFGHSAKEIDASESAMLVIQLASPVTYSPFKNPNFARERQKEILSQMEKLHFITQEEVDSNFDAYWDNFDYTREGFSGAFLKRDDKAPYFSEYIRNILKTELGFSNEEINTNGYTIYTSLNLDVQKKAEGYFTGGLTRANRIYKSNIKQQRNKQETIFPTMTLIMNLFDGTGSFLRAGVLQAQAAKKYFLTTMHPIVSLSHLLFEASPNTIVGQTIGKSQKQSLEIDQEETVEGALITIDNVNHRIVAMIGGSKFDATNQFNRAVNAFVQPGSSFKPLYYAAALDAKIITPSTIIWDSPVIFHDQDGQAYAPKNYKGEWKGPVTIRTALSHSMNVASLKVLNQIGFDRALSTTGALLDLQKSDWKRAGLVPKYPIGLGIVSVSPFAMAKAYATIENLGKKISPISILYIKDRTGKTIYQYEKNPTKLFEKEQIISPPAAYILTSILQTTTQSGTLAYARSLAKGFTQPTAGKTGTTQNWSDSWTIGFTPYYTTAIWMGFDRGGQSLGTNQTGAITTGPVWAKYMEDINKALPIKNFKRPNNIVSVVINPNTNKIAVSRSKKKRKEIYIAGTEPKIYDTPNETILIETQLINKLEESRWNLTLPNNTSPPITKRFQNKNNNIFLNIPSKRFLSRKQPSKTLSNKKDNNTQSQNTTEKKITNPFLE